MQSTELTGAWGFGSQAWLPSAVLASMALAFLAIVVHLLARQK
jgi:hypothetical protein